MGRARQKSVSHPKRLPVIWFTRTLFPSSRRSASTPRKTPITVTGKILKNKVEYIIPSAASNLYLYCAIKNITRLMSVNRTVSPLTGLPGNVQILAELKKRLLRKEPFEILYLER